jgi:hypothetical protein
VIPATDGALVQRLFERLLVALGTDSLEGSFTIGDVYQRLIPYRSVRSEIGVMELASYEYGLLRLLGGEGGYLKVEGESASEEIRRELASPNPIVGIYRDYAEVGVRIVGRSAGREQVLEEVSPTTRAQAGSEAGLPEARAEIRSPGREATPGDSATAATGRGREETVGASRSAADADTGRNRIPQATPGANPTQTDGPVAAAVVCAGCAADLPTVGGIRFCPFCGHLREPFPCGRCGTRLEPEWNFCIRCGAAAGS